MIVSSNDLDLSGLQRWPILRARVSSGCLPWGVTWSLSLLIGRRNWTESAPNCRHFKRAQKIHISANGVNSPETTRCDLRDYPLESLYSMLETCRRKQRPGGSRSSAFVNCARVDFVVLCAETTLPASLPPPSQNDHSTARTIVSFIQLLLYRPCKSPASHHLKEAIFFKSILETPLLSETAFLWPWIPLSLQFLRMSELTPRGMSAR